MYEFFVVKKYFRIHTYYSYILSYTFLYILCTLTKIRIWYFTIIWLADTLFTVLLMYTNYCRQIKSVSMSAINCTITFISVS